MIKQFRQWIQKQIVEEVELLTFDLDRRSEQLIQDSNILNMQMNKVASHIKTVIPHRDLEHQLADNQQHLLEIEQQIHKLSEQLRQLELKIEAKETEDTFW
ncbi:hypothetical protein ACQ4M3_09290 [Leptolyngbya sp. AN03gr2]|uniref:hypothetical protein n=1 Tax=Leptolyngbya sp. AN03gr2 TaxID=3423364 RepID=UPI003D317815